jgi:hypothetical protein
MPLLDMMVLIGPSGAKCRGLLHTELHHHHSRANSTTQPTHIPLHSATRGGCLALHIAWAAGLWQCVASSDADQLRQHRLRCCSLQPGSSLSDHLGQWRERSHHVQLPAAVPSTLLVTTMCNILRFLYNDTTTVTAIYV